MALVEKAVRRTWIPHGGQKGGMFSNTHPYDADPDTFQFIEDVLIDGATWRPRPALTSQGTNTGNVTSVAVFNFYTGSSQTLVSRLMAGQVDGKVRDMSLNSDIRTGLSASFPVVFSPTKNRLYCCNGVDTPFIYDGLTTSYNWGVAGQIANLTGSLQNIFTTGTLSVVNGSNAIVGTGTTFQAGDVGKPIVVNGVPLVVGTFTDATHITTTQPYSGVTAAAVGYTVYRGSLKWTLGAGFRYGVSYWAPSTGHISNGSPILSIDVGDVNNITTNLDIRIDNILGTNDPVYTKIIVWRTGHQGGTLFPLAVINNNFVGATFYVDTQNDDTQLGTVGPGFVTMPLFTNAPPPTDLNYATYWDGRFWGFSSTSIGLLYFSARSDGIEIPCGVGEESWPKGNTLPVPEADGRGRGCRVVGGVLYVFSDRGIFAVRGNSPSNYILDPVSAKGNGTYHFATTRLAGEDSNSGDVLVHMGNDGVLYFLFGPGGDIGYSYPVQDNFKNVAADQFVLQTVHDYRSVYILVGSKQINRTFIFDVNRKIWLRSTIPAFAFTEALFSGAVKVFASTGAGVSTVLDNAASIGTACTIVGQFVWPSNTERAAEKILQSFKLYSSSLAVTYAVTVTIDNGSPISLTQLAADPQLEPDALVFAPPTDKKLSGRIFQFALAWTSTTNHGPRAFSALWTVTTEDGMETANL